MNDLDKEQIDNRYDLVAWITKQVKKRINVDFDELKKEKLMLEQSHKALNDRTNNLQIIYNKMSAIENKLKPFQELGKFFQDDEIMKPVQLEEVPEEKEDEILKLKVNEVDYFSVRTCNILKAMHLKTVGSILEKTERDFLIEPNCGRKTLTEIKDFLAQYNYRLKNK